MNIKSLNPQYIFVIVGLIYGIAFLITVPPFQVPDEYDHYYKALDISNGNIIPVKIGNNMAGVYVPESAKILTDSIYQKWTFFIKDREKIGIYSLLNLPYNNDNKVFVDISKFMVITYSPVPYLAAVLTITLGKMFGLSPLVLLYLGRFGTLLLWLLVIFLAIKTTPVFKWVFLAISLMPLTLFQAASLSADSLTIALSFLTIAIFLKLSLDKNIKKIDTKHVLILILISLLLGLTKLPYVLLFFMFFLIPAHKFGNKKRMILIFGLIALLTILLVGTWNAMANGLYMTINPGVSAKDQLFFVLLHPLDFIQILINTLFAFNLGMFPFIIVGVWGWPDMPLPYWVYIIYFFALFAIAILDKNPIKITSIQKYIILGLFLFITLTIFLTEYVTWTSVGAPVILGVQSRYFIPILPLLFVILYRRGSNNKNRPLPESIITVFIIFSLSTVVFAFINQYVFYF